MRLTPLIALLSASLIACGIPEETHNAALRDLENTKIELANAQAAHQADAAAKDKQIAELDGKVAALDGKIAELEASIAQQEAALADQKNTISIYENKTGSLEKDLKSSKAELVELRKARAAAEKAAQQYRQLTERLASMVQSGKLSVTIRRGRMVLLLANNILFDTGKTELREEGKAAIVEVANVLKEIANRQYLVTGHTDNVPLGKNSRFKSNWELSTARAVEVVQVLQSSGVAPSQLAAAGYGEFDPVGSNDAEEGRALNRRIEIVLMPNLDEMPQLPSDLTN
jgi:chemotaxis protein MotB